MGMIKIRYTGTESPIAFSCIGGKPALIRTGDEVEVPQEVFDADMINDPRWEKSGSSEPVKSKKGAK